MSKLVSVIIPSYNHEAYIEQTIRSIIAQTYDNIELLVIDDGSKNGTRAILESLKPQCEKRFKRVVFEYQQNQGVCKTQNRLIQISQGDYVYLIASDDLAKPEAIELEVDFLEKNPQYALVTGDNEIIDANGKIIYWSRKRFPVKFKYRAKFRTYGEFLQKSNDIDLSSEDFGTYKALYHGNHVPNGYLIRKCIFQKTGLFTDKKLLEDHYMMLQISKYAKMKYLNRILFSYRWHDTNTISNSTYMKDVTKRMFEYEYELIKKQYEKGIVDKNVIELWENGEFRTFFKIPFVFEIIKFKHIKENKHGRIAKLFGITIYKKTKPIF